ncbi:GGDEF domain-containing protein [Propionivibrio limicola]|uniref:GGDEF domain-containing protein n=1 Tax=Propionivibrio limicola TaxID=167645 RepID=UPI001291AA20|nr:GGDEF domain-containing protein [Propionivibrio limicola]
MNLRPRFHLLTIVFFIIFAIPSWLAVRALAEGIMEQWAVRYAEKQVLYDKGRTLQPILREVALSRQLASSQPIREWAHKPENKDFARRAVAEMEGFRKNFQDHSYFVALLKNGHYFHNNAANEFAGEEFRYVMDPRNKKDAWFYDLIRKQRDIHINVNPDPNLGVTKLWIDVLIRDGNDILGIAGTGLDLTAFIKNVVEEDTPGVTSLFVDHDGAIQIHRNQSLIDFASISKTKSQQNTIKLLFDREDDHKAVLAAMKELEVQKKTVATLFVQVGGKRHIAGIAYLPEIDWHEITLLDLDVLLPFSQFTGILVVYTLTLLGILFLFNLALRRFVLTPLQQLDKAMAAVETGSDVPPELERLGSGEIGRLMKRFVQMAKSVTVSRRDLEFKVQERTIALERLTKIDPLTELLNRRGMSERIEAELMRARREQNALGLLWLDVDGFKEINDRYGHAAGDRALETIAGIIDATIRPYDVAARWGGDEFLIMLYPADEATLRALGERLLDAIASCRNVTGQDGTPIALRASIGGHSSASGEDFTHLLQQADRALYAAKADGRNCYRSSPDALENHLIRT